MRNKIGDLGSPVAIADGLKEMAIRQAEVHNLGSHDDLLEAAEHIVNTAYLETMLGKLVDACEFHNGTLIFRETISEAKKLLNSLPTKMETK